MRLGYLTSKSGGLLENMLESKLFNDIDIKVYSNKPNIELVDRTRKYNISLSYFKKNSELVDLVKNDDLILSAGYLRILPGDIIRQMPPIINIHPGIKGYEGLDPQKRMINDKSPYVGQFIHEMDETLDGGKKLYYVEYLNTFKTVEELDIFLKQNLLRPLKTVINMYKVKQ